LSKFHPLPIADVRHETRDAIAVTFDVPPALTDAFRFTQGQHLTLRAKIDGEELRRSYSICSAVHDRDLRIAIKRAPGGVFSTWANETLKAGHTIDVMPPMGHFNTPLAAANRRRYLAFDAGSGITPLLSIIKTTLHVEPQSEFTLFYGNRASSAVIFREDLADLKDRYLERFNLVYVMSREQQDIELFNGRITREKCDQYFRLWVRPDEFDVAFICGPDGMMRAVAESLEAHGMPKANIKIVRALSRIQGWMADLEADDRNMARKLARAQQDKKQLLLWNDLPKQKKPEREPETAPKLELVASAAE